MQKFMQKGVFYFLILSVLCLVPTLAKAGGISCDIGEKGDFKKVMTAKDGVDPGKAIVRGPCVAAFARAIFSGCNGLCSGGSGASLQKPFNFADIKIIPSANAAGMPSPGSFLQDCFVKEAEVKAIETATSDEAEVEGRCDNIKNPLHPAMRMHMSVVTSTMPKPPQGAASNARGVFMPAVFVKSNNQQLYSTVQLEAIASFFAMKGIEKGFFTLFKAFPKYGPGTFGASSLPTDGKFKW